MLGKMGGRSFRHWSPRYVRDRVAMWWYEKTHAESPWLTSSAVGFLDGWLRRGDAGFEWGAGRSTLWLAHRVGSLISIEHDPEWFAKVKGEIQRNGVSNVRLSLCGLEGDERSAYVQSIEPCQPETLDFVLVDGRLRHACAAAALSRIRPGGLLILDNAERYLSATTHSPSARRGPAVPEWQPVETQLAAWTRIWTSNGVFDTALFLKPGR